MKTALTMISLMALLMISIAAAGEEIMETRYGHVTSKHEVRGHSNVATGAVIGGLAGLLTAHGKSGGKKVTHAAGGALLGGVIANQVDKSRRYWRYTIGFPNGGETDLEIQEDQLDLGDCAAVHYGVQQTSVEYSSEHFCRVEANQQVESEAIAVALPANDPCMQAKQRLLDSNDPQQDKILIEKIRVICE